MTRCCCLGMWRRQAALALNGTAGVQASGKGPSSYTAQLPTPIGPIHATRCQRRNTAGPHREDEESKPMMHEPERSDSAIVARKPANKAGRPVAELVERRAGIEGNAGQQSTCRAQNRESVSQALDRVRQAAVIGGVSLNT